MFLNEHEKDDDGNGCQQGCSKQILPFDHVEGRELGDTDRDRFICLGGNQYGGNRILVPCVDELNPLVN